jgi:RHS repeat-associated protein
MFDDWGRPISSEDPGTGDRQFRYSGFDEMVEETDARGMVHSYAYDRLGRLTEKRNGEDELIAKWSYDGDGPNELGRLVGSFRQAAGGSGAGTWTLVNYDAEGGLPSSLEYRLGASSGDPDSGEDHVISYSYDSTIAGRITHVTYPSDGDFFQLEYGFDDSTGAINSVSPVSSGGTVGAPFWRLDEVDGGYRPSVETFGNGVSTTRTYFRPADCTGGPDVSCVGQLKTLQTDGPGGTIDSSTYTWDGNGNLASRSRGEGATSMDYDGHDRLTRETLTTNLATEVRDYTYDDAGNFMYKDGVGTYSYGPSGTSDPCGFTDSIARMRDAGDTHFCYDQNGNTTERIGDLAKSGYQKLDYNDFDMPHRITTGIGTNATETEFEYTATGQRVVQRDRQAAATTARERIFIGDLYERTTGPGILTEHRFKVLVGSRQVAEVVRTNGDDRVLYLHTDHLGSTSTITDQPGDTVETRRYSAFGAQTSTGTTTGVLAGYTGHNDDPDLGITNMRGRLYDQKLGRFLTPDPFVTNPGSSQGWNRYAYVENNPFVFVDPSGFQANCTIVSEQTSCDPQNPGNCVTIQIPFCPPVAPPTYEGDQQRAEEARRQAADAQVGSGPAPSPGFAMPTLTPSPPEGQEGPNLLNLPPSGDPWEAVFGFKPPPLPDAPEVPGLVELPQSGPGYVAVSPHRFGTPRLIDTLRETARIWHDTAPPGVSRTLRIGDLSRRGGGDFPPHVSHKAGLDADISVIVNDAPGQQQWPTNRFPPNYSHEGTQELVHILQHTGGSQVRLILSADKLLTGVAHDTSHFNHIHLSLRP